MPRPAALSLSAIDCEAPEEAAPLLRFVFLDIALARACAAADNTHSASVSFDILRCDVLVYHFLGMGNGTAHYISMYIYACMS